jgi:hypothetical protein
MPHLMLTSALLFALLAIVATAIGACFGIARDLMLEDADETVESELTPSGTGQIGLAEDFGLGLRHHAANFAQDSAQSFRRGGSLNA